MQEFSSLFSDPKDSFGLHRATTLSDLGHNLVSSLRSERKVFECRQSYDSFFPGHWMCTWDEFKDIDMVKTGSRILSEPLSDVSRGLLAEGVDIKTLAASFDPVVGDRRQELVFIGAPADEAAISAALDACLVTDEEWEKFKSGEPMEEKDPFDDWITFDEDEEEEDDEEPVVEEKIEAPKPEKKVKGKTSANQVEKVPKGKSEKKSAQKKESKPAKSSEKHEEVKKKGEKATKKQIQPKEDPKDQKSSAKVGNKSTKAVEKRKAESSEAAKGKKVAKK